MLSGYGERKKKAMPRLLLVGVDGASWQVIRPLVEAGRMKTFAGLIENGCIGTIHSYPYSASPVMWTSIATGMVPIKHGIRDFHTPPSQLRAKDIWNILADAGWRVGLFQFLGIWHKQEKPAFIMPGWLYPEAAVHPPELASFKSFREKERNGDNGYLDYVLFFLRMLRNGLSLEALVRALRLLIWRTFNRSRAALDKYRGQILDIALSTDMFLDLLKSHRPDAGGIIFYQTDAAGHKYWKYKEPELFGGVSEEERRKYGNVLDQTYVSIDRALGRILGKLPRDCLVVVISDHGMGPALHPSRRLYRPALQSFLAEHKVLDGELPPYIGNDFFIRLTDDLDRAQVQYDRLVSLVEGVVLVETNEPIFAIERVASDFARVRMALAGPEYLEKLIRLPDGNILPYTKVVDISETFSGRHEPDGIFLLKGPNVRSGLDVGSLKLEDVVPTLLALLGKPIAHDMDGRVIESAISPHWLTERPIRWIDSYGAPEDLKENSPKILTEEQSDVREQLRNLGYL